MKRISLVVLALVALLVSACSFTAPVCATSNPVGAKVGEATMTVILGFPSGECTIAKAAKNGGISKISTVDMKYTPGLFSSAYTTVVTGE